MITVGMNYRTLAGKEEIFEKAFDGVLKALQKSTGHVKSQLLRDVKDSQSYVITSEWTEEEYFNTFIRSEAFRNVTNWGKEQILAERPTHQVYRQAEPVSSHSSSSGCCRGN